MAGQNLRLSVRYFVRFSKEPGSTDSDDRSSIRAQGATFVTYCHTPLSLLEVQLRLLKLSLGAVLDVFKFAYRQENRLHSCYTKTIV